MLFNSLQYACFLPVVFAVTFLLPNRLRPWFLLAASYWFYASWNALYLLLIIGLTLFNYGVGLALDRLRDHDVASNWVVGAGVAVDLGVLGFYKYSVFALQNVAAVGRWFGVQVSVPQMSVLLPLGISFFTFEFIHYLVDIRRGHSVVRSPLKFALFAGFFPTQIAGPIKRYENFIPQVDNPKPRDWAQLGLGLQWVVLGLFKKVALADNLAPIVQTGFQSLLLSGNQSLLTPGDAWITALAFAFQIYFDFSGYTDIGRGSALMLGYTVPANFNRPYLSRNVSEFWHRWHISLSTWLRDYLYIPLGGNRRHRYRNLLLTMVLGGLWHGANWTFVIWGTLHGAMLATFWRIKTWRRRPEGEGSHGWTWDVASGAVSWAFTFVLVCVAWVFFRAPTFEQALRMLGAMVGWHTVNTPILPVGQRWLVRSIVAGTLAVEGLMELKERQALSRWSTILNAWLTHLRPIAYVLLFAVTLTFKPSAEPLFIYFHF